MAALIRNITDGGKTGSKFRRDELVAEFHRNGPSLPALIGVAASGAARDKGKKRTLAYLLESLKEEGAIEVQRNGPIEVLNLSPGALLEPSPAA